MTLLIILLKPSSSYIESFLKYSMLQINLLRNKL